MERDQLFVLGVLAGALVLFIHGRLRHDVVAFLALLSCVLLGVVDPDEAFSGFSHPATITVALVLVASRGLAASGAIDRLAHLFHPATAGPARLVGSLSVVGAGLSAFMNNVGALALLMPMAIDSSERGKQSPAVVLMPLSFATILGGMVTLIGTPPNIIVAGFRAEATGEAFAMFDFARVGGVVALVGLAYVTLVGWRLVPAERRRYMGPRELLAVDDYLAEARLPAGSKWRGEPVRALFEPAAEHDVRIVGLIRGKRRYWSSAPSQDLKTRDVLLLEAAPRALGAFAEKTGLELLGASGRPAEDLRSPEVKLAEAVVTAGSWLSGRTVRSAQIARRHAVSLLAVARQGKPVRTRLADFDLRPGDVLLLHGEPDRVEDALAAMGALPLHERDLRLAPGRRWLPALGLFVAAIGSAAFGLLPLLVAFAVLAAAFVLSRLLPLRDLYTAIDWPVIVLLGALIPVGGALESTGATAALAGALSGASGGWPLPLLLAGLMAVTMTLSDVMNNAATAVVMAPLATGLAQGLGASPDPFLMAVAVGASCAFLTPIGHQNNTLVLGPGGYRFGDYWRMGLPLELLIVGVGVPAIMAFWPA